jgi:hypothetical protein
MAALVCVSGSWAAESSPLRGDEGDADDDGDECLLLGCD